MDDLAKITAKEGYKCAPNGHKILTFELGAEVSGQIAKWALADNAAKRLFPKGLKTKNAGSAPENKATGKK